MYDSNFICDRAQIIIVPRVHVHPTSLYNVLLGNDFSSTCVFVYYRIKYDLILISVFMALI